MYIYIERMTSKIPRKYIKTTHTKNSPQEGPTLGGNMM